MDKLRNDRQYGVEEQQDVDLWMREREREQRDDDVSVAVVWRRPLFAHHTQLHCVVPVFMSELITGRHCQLPDQ